MAQVRAVDRLLSRYGTLDTITEAVLMEAAVETPNALVLLLAAFRKLVGKSHPATIAVTTALARQKDWAHAKKDRRPRELVLENATWDKLRAQPGHHEPPFH